MIDQTYVLDMDALTSIEDLPGVEGEVLPVYKPLELVKIDSNAKDRKIDLESDYGTVRESFHHQKDMLMDAAKILLETAKNSDSPRHMEVFATLMGQLTNTNKEIIKLHNEMKGITNEQVNVANGQNPQNAGGINVQNAQIFMGSSADLMDEIGDAQDIANREVGVQ